MRARKTEISADIRAPLSLNSKSYRTKKVTWDGFCWNELFYGSLSAFRQAQVIYQNVLYIILQVSLINVSLPESVLPSQLHTRALLINEIAKQQQLKSKTANPNVNLNPNPNPDPNPNLYPNPRVTISYFAISQLFRCLAECPAHTNCVIL